MAKARKKTLRQRMREAATSEVEIVRNKLVHLAAQIAGEHNVSTTDLLKFAVDSGNKSVKNRLVTRIANTKEVELETLYLQQTEKSDVDQEKA